MIDEGSRHFEIRVWKDEGLRLDGWWARFWFFS